MAGNNLRAMTSLHSIQKNQATDDEGAIETQSEATFASGLQMSMIENRLEAETTKLTSMV